MGQKSSKQPPFCVRVWEDAGRGYIQKGDAMRRSAAVAVLATTFSIFSVQAQVGLEQMPAPVDPESWTLPEWMTWDDYRPIPGVNWNDPERQPPKKLRAALILADYPDREFIVSRPEGSEVIGLDGQHNPIGIGSIPREQVGDFYADFLIRTPQPLNNFHTVNEYWLEDSYGLIGVDATAFGPYLMSRKEHEYGLGGGDAGGGDESCPSGDSCGQDIDTEMLEASLADVTLGMIANGGEDYDFRWLLHAGYDESGVWAEFGPMLFPTKEDVPASLGNPDPTKPNWTTTRYVEWTSFAAGEGEWSHALPGVYSIQGENDGAAVFAHELSHIFGVLDNYNNPYAETPQRAYTGLWEMLSRGSFNGPGGAHNRWQIPPTLGATMGAHHMLRNKMRLGFMKPNEVVVLPKQALAATGPVFLTIFPRAYPLFPITQDIGLHGAEILIGRDLSPACTIQERHDCDGGGYISYTVEVVDRIGYDSFTPDYGVLIAKNKDLVDLAPFMWVIDAHPEDINTRVAPPPNAEKAIFDYYQPVVVPETFAFPTSGEKVPITKGDPRQIADALFKAGTGEGVVSEYVDEPNGLHFYVLGMQLDIRGVRTYRVAIRSLDGAGPAPRGLALVQSLAGEASAGRVATARFTLRNLGTETDLVRVSAEHPQGWRTQLQHTVIEIPAGETREVPVYVQVPEGARDNDTALRFTARSETGPAARLDVQSAVKVAASARSNLGRFGGALGAGVLLMLLVGAGMRRCAAR